jgi:hypothetical protein
MSTPLKLAYVGAALLAVLGMGVIAIVWPGLANVLSFGAGVLIGILPVASWHLLVKLWLGGEGDARKGWIILVLAAKFAIFGGLTYAALATDLADVVNFWALMAGMVAAIQVPLVTALVLRPELDPVGDAQGIS